MSIGLQQAGTDSGGEENTPLGPRSATSFSSSQYKETASLKLVAIPWPAWPLATVGRGAWRVESSLDSCLGTAGLGIREAAGAGVAKLLPCCV
ncbi:cAMP-dependent protein kinase inhibitor gamma isoform X1 [Chroicocephalus ridibundus]|uniref:cAMP-dependent protein kinase inhibitor gamma isoform X1 n=1 Tax=Chroicocephalus ridibundus TaxID=1192867 RepID=UPI002FDCDBFA